VPTPTILSFNGSVNVYDGLEVPKVGVAMVPLAASKSELFGFKPSPLTVIIA
jgi:hypothetical protein